MFFRAEFLVHLELDGEAVAVPAGHIRSVEAAHPLALQDDILENLVQGVADMDMAVCVGGAVVEDIIRPVFAGVQQLFVKSGLFPGIEYFQLLLGKIRFHREFGGRQVQSIFIVHKIYPSRVLYVQGQMFQLIHHYSFSSTFIPIWPINRDNSTMASAVPPSTSLTWVASPCSSPSAGSTGIQYPT